MIGGRTYEEVDREKISAIKQKQTYMKVTIIGPMSLVSVLKADDVQECDRNSKVMTQNYIKEKMGHFR